MNRDPSPTGARTRRSPGRGASRSRRLSALEEISATCGGSWDPEATALWDRAAAELGVAGAAWSPRNPVKLLREARRDALERLVSGPLGTGRSLLERFRRETRWHGARRASRLAAPVAYFLHGVRRHESLSVYAGGRRDPGGSSPRGSRGRPDERDAQVARVLVWSPARILAPRRRRRGTRGRRTPWRNRPPGRPGATPPGAVAIASPGGSARGGDRPGPERSRDQALEGVPPRFPQELDRIARAPGRAGHAQLRRRPIPKGGGLRVPGPHRLREISSRAERRRDRDAPRPESAGSLPQSGRVSIHDRQLRYHPPGANASAPGGVSPWRIGFGPRQNPRIISESGPLGVVLTKAVSEILSTARSP